MTAEDLVSNAALVLDCVKENGSYGRPSSSWTCLSEKKLSRRGFEAEKSSWRCRVEKTVFQELHCAVSKVDVDRRKLGCYIHEKLFLGQASVQ